MPSDYRYKPFDDVLEPVAISGETHIIPINSPYTIRLHEIPVKDDPSSLSLTIDGVSASEVAANPAQGEFWPDYSTGADGDENWNTGLIQFNAADAGKTVVANYNGMGSLVSAEYHGRQLFTSSGTFTVPKGVRQVFVSGCGGGGAGGEGFYDGESGAAGMGFGGGGGGSACAFKQALTVVSGQSYTITIGNGGVGNPNAGANTAGGASSFGALLTLAGGGKASALAGGASGGAYGSNGQDGGVGGLTGGAGGTIFGSGAGGNNAGSGFGSGGGGGWYCAAGKNGSKGFILVEW